MTDPVALELRRLADHVALLTDRLDHLGARLDRLVPPPLGELQRELLQSLAQCYPHTFFSSADVVDALRVPVGHWHRLRAALQALDAAVINNPHRLGMEFGALVRASAAEPLRLVSPKTEAGVRLWRVEWASGA